MIRLDVPFVILRPRESEEGLVCLRVTVRCDLALAERYFPCTERFAPLYTILAYFLLSWTTLVRKKSPCGPLFVFSQGITI